MQRYAIALDLGGTTLKYAVVNSQGEILHAGKLPTPATEGAEAVLAQMTLAVDRCVEFAHEKGYALEGVGIGTPGVISEDERVVLGGAENIEGWEMVPLSERIEAHCGLPTWVNNDANLMALGETMFGAGKGASDVVFLTIGTGIGGGVLIDGKLWGGYRNRGTEFGHMTVKYDGEECACGSVGCLEHYASTSALVRRFKARCEELQRPCEAADGEQIVALYHAGDPLACEVMEEHWNILALGLVGIIHIFSPEKVVIGGGISEAGPFYIEALRQRVERRAMAVSREGCELVAATLGNRAGVLGAAALAFAKGVERPESDC